MKTTERCSLCGDAETVVSIDGVRRCLDVGACEGRRRAGEAELDPEIAAWMNAPMGPRTADAKPCGACGGKGWLPAHNPHDPGERVACPDCPRSNEARFYDGPIQHEDGSVTYVNAPRSDKALRPDELESESDEPEIVAEAMAAASRLIARARGGGAPSGETWPHISADVDDVASALVELRNRMRRDEQRAANPETYQERTAREVVQAQGGCGAVDRESSMICIQAKGHKTPCFDDADQVQPIAAEPQPRSETASPPPWVHRNNWDRLVHVAQLAKAVVDAWDNDDADTDNTTEAMRALKSVLEKTVAEGEKKP